jgi:hypothetical protein
MQEEGYLRSVSAYVHLNPVRVRGWKKKPVAERLRRVAAYPWSSYRDYTERVADRAPRVICDPVWGDLGARTQREGRRRYREYVHGWLIEKSENPLADVKRGCYLGGGDFGDWIERLLAGEKPISDQIVGHREWRRSAVVMADLMARICELWGVSTEAVQSRQRPNESRDVAIYLCREVGAKGLREIGCLLGVKSSAVSLAAKRVRQRMVADAGFRRRLLAAKGSLVKISDCAEKPPLLRTNG